MKRRKTLVKAFHRNAKGLSRPIIIAALANAHKGPTKKGFVELGITAATPKEVLIGYLHSTELAKNHDTFKSKVNSELPQHMLAEQTQTEEIADRLRELTQDKTVRVTAEWNESGWQLQKALHCVDKAVESARYTQDEVAAASKAAGKAAAKAQGKPIQKDRRAAELATLRERVASLQFEKDEMCARFAATEKMYWQMAKKVEELVSELQLHRRLGGKVGDEAELPAGEMTTAEVSTLMGQLGDLSAAELGVLCCWGVLEPSRGADSDYELRWDKTGAKTMRRVQAYVSERAASKPDERAGSVYRWWKRRLERGHVCEQHRMSVSGLQVRRWRFGGMAVPRAAMYEDYGQHCRTTGVARCPDALWARTLRGMTRVATKRQVVDPGGEPVPCFVFQTLRDCREEWCANDLGSLRVGSRAGEDEDTSAAAPPCYA